MQKENLCDFLRNFFLSYLASFLRGNFKCSARSSIEAETKVKPFSSSTHGKPKGEKKGSKKIFDVTNL